jgi:hypothetical protein
MVSARSGRREAAATSPCTGFRRMIVSVLGVVGMILSPGPVSGQVHIDLTNAQVIITGKETLRFNRVTVPGIAGTFFANVQWSAVGFEFVPTDFGVEDDSLLSKTVLLKGHWHFVYTIISTFTNDYGLTTIPGTTNSQGGFFIHGTGESNDPVVATYFPKDGNYSLLDPGIIIDRFFVFHTDGNTILPGSCYYQINPPGSNNFSRCYTLTGVKTPLAKQNVGPELEEEDARAREVAQAEVGTVTEVHPTVLEQYRLLRGGQ